MLCRQIATAELEELAMMSEPANVDYNTKRPHTSLGGLNEDGVQTRRGAQCDLDEIDPYYARARTALFQLEIPLDVVAEGARRARDRGLVTVLDAGPPRDAPIELLSAFDVVSPNEKELAAVSGREVRGIKSAMAAAKELAGAGIKRIVVKMGADGALLVAEGDAVHVPPFEIDAVDSTGAGDAFTAGLAVALAEGAGDHEAVRFANAAGAAGVTVLGAIPSMPERSAVERLLARGESM